MPGRDATQGDVRRRDRFRCQYCGATGEQYAHIVPDSDGGEYALDNLLFLCYSCHKNWQEPAKASPEMRDRLSEIGRNLRDKSKTDAVISNTFGFPAGGELVVTLGGGVRFVNQERILEREADPTRPYLSLGADSFGILHINAYFDDADGHDFMHVEDNVLKVHTAAAWDVVFSRRYMRFEHADREMKLEIRQADNLDLQITGSLYLNGGRFVITNERIVDTIANIIMQRNIAVANGMGLLLAPGRISF